MIVDASTSRLVRRMTVVGALLMVTACSKPKPSPDIPLLEPGLWAFEIETRREGQPVETRTIRDCVGLRGLYSADRPTDCGRIESRRSPDGKTLLVEVECAVAARRPSDARIVMARGRGPLDFMTFETRITSRSEFTGDLRKAFVRDNVTVYEAPLGERQTTRRITRAAWQGVSCPADLPPDDLSRWIMDPAGEPVVGVKEPVPKQTEKVGEALAEAPRMRTGLWESRVTTVTDGGAPVTEVFRDCLTWPDGDSVPVPSLLPFNMCVAVAEVKAVVTASGIETSTRCELPSYRIMASDLQLETPTLDITSRSEIQGDLSARIQVRHSTDVIYGSGRRESIQTSAEISRLGECPVRTE
jgi:hypothetical protein